MDLIIETLPGKRFDSPKPRPEESVLYARDSSRILLSTMNEIAGRWVIPVVVAVCHVKPGPRKNAADEQRDRERERGRLRKKEATGCIPVAIREWNFKTTAPFIYSMPRFAPHNYTPPTCRTLTYDRQSVPRLTRRQWSADTSKTLSDIRDKKNFDSFLRVHHDLWMRNGSSTPRGRGREEAQVEEESKFSKGRNWCYHRVNHFVTRLLSTEECWINNFFEGYKASQLGKENRAWFRIRVEFMRFTWILYEDGISNR